MRQVLSPDDLKAGELAENGWIPVEVVNYDESEAGEDAKSPGSTNCNFYFKVLDGPSKGIEIKKLINESPKSLGFNKALWAAFGFPKTATGGYDLDSSLFKKTVGFKLMGYNKPAKSNRGNMYNDLVDFKPMT